VTFTIPRSRRGRGWCCTARSMERRRNWLRRALGHCLFQTDSLFFFRYRSTSGIWDWVNPEETNPALGLGSPRSNHGSEEGLARGRRFRSLCWNAEVSGRFTTIRNPPTSRRPACTPLTNGWALSARPSKSGATASCIARGWLMRPCLMAPDCGLDRRGHIKGNL
jgi:hypothetical protein